MKAKAISQTKINTTELLELSSKLEPDVPELCLPVPPDCWSEGMRHHYQAEFSINL